MKGQSSCSHGDGHWDKVLDDADKYPSSPESSILVGSEESRERGMVCPERLEFT